MDRPRGSPPDQDLAFWSSAMGPVGPMMGPTGRGLRVTRCPHDLARFSFFHASHLAPTPMLHVAMISPTELWPVLLIVLVFFGQRKLPELARAAGSSINQFKRGLKEEPDLLDPPDEGDPELPRASEKSAEKTT